MESKASRTSRNIRARCSRSISGFCESPRVVLLCLLVRDRVDNWRVERNPSPETEKIRRRKELSFELERLSSRGKILQIQIKSAPPSRPFRRKSNGLKAFHAAGFKTCNGALARWVIFSSQNLPTAMECVRAVTRLSRAAITSLTNRKQWLARRWK